MKKWEYKAWLEANKGKTFGHLTVAAMKHVGSGEWIILECVCGIRISDKINKILKYGKHKKCKLGCPISATDIWLMLNKNIQFGYWTILGPSPSHRYAVMAKCICGTTHEVHTSKLSARKSKSCGCQKTTLYRETCVERYGVINIGAHLPAKQKVKQTVLDRYGVTNVFQSKEVQNKIKTTNLSRYGTEHYGFTGQSEERTKHIFSNYFNKLFISVRPEFLANPETGYCLELDGYCEELKLAFEYDGRQHHEEVWGGPEELAKIQHRDKIKDKLCKAAGVILVRVPYWENKNLESFIHKALRDLGYSNVHCT